MKNIGIGNLLELPLVLVTIQSFLDMEILPPCTDVNQCLELEVAKNLAINHMGNIASNLLIMDQLRRVMMMKTSVLAQPFLLDEKLFQNSILSKKPNFLRNDYFFD